MSVEAPHFMRYTPARYPWCLSVNIRTAESVFLTVGMMHRCLLKYFNIIWPSLWGCSNVEENISPVCGHSRHFSGHFVGLVQLEGIGPIVGLAKFVNLVIPRKHTFHPTLTGSHIMI